MCMLGLVQSKVSYEILWCDCYLSNLLLEFQYSLLCMQISSGHRVDDSYLTIICVVQSLLHQIFSKSLYITSPFVRLALRIEIWSATMGLHIAFLMTSSRDSLSASNPLP
jgi:hypothetical protein